MIKGLVSVVLPIYNVEQYLNRCMESIVNQTYTNLEIIMVDDGSPDKCPAICEQWAKNDERIKVIHKENAGLGMARNTGLDCAAGEFICFFDSDDYIALDTIEKTVLLADKTNADIVTFGHSVVSAKGVINKSFVPNTSKEFYCNEEILNYVLPNLIAPDVKSGPRTNLWMSAWASLYKQSLLKKDNWHFASERDIIAEDVYSLLKLYKNIKGVAVLPEPKYFYCENHSSLTHTYREDRYDKIKFFYDSCIKVCEEYGYSNEVKKRLSGPYISFTTAALKMIVSSDNPIIKKRELVKGIVNDEHLQFVLKHSGYRPDSIKRSFFCLMLKLKVNCVVYELLNKSI